MTTLSVVRDCSGGSAPRALEVDTSDEMEEIRELLYGLINEEFPAGVRSDFLQKTYEKKYSDVALGPKLPSNWLEQIEHSEEFELQRRGHLILVYTRQRDLPEPIDVTQIVTPLKATALNLSASHAKTTIASSQACKLYKASVTSFGAATLCTIAWASDAFDKFAISPREDILHGVWNLKVAMKEHFSDGSIDEASADAVPQPGNLYAVKEKDFWYRVEVLSIVGAEFAMVFFVDRGAVARVGQKEVLPLNAKFTDAVKWPAFFLPSMLSMSARLESKFVDSCRGAISSGDGAKCEVRFMRFDDASRRFLVDLVEDSLVVVEKRPDSGASRHSDSAVDDRKNSTVSLSSAPPRSSSAGGTALPAFEPLVAKEMVTGRPFAVSILYMEDPDNISDPIPEYMYNSLSRDWETLPPLAESDVIGGSLYIAKTKHGFERVRAVRSEEGLWRVFAIDIGAYEEVAVADLKALTTVGSFMKVMMLKCRLDGLIPNSPEEKWPDNSRTVLADIARSAKKVQLVPVGEWAKWSCEDSLIPVPYVTCRLEVDNVDVSRLLVDRGVALQR